MNNKEIVFSKMAESAQKFCEAIEKFDSSETGELLTALITLLFWSNALSQYSIEAEDDDVLMESRHELGNVPGDIAFYNTFNPNDASSVAASSLRDALKDILNPLQGGLEILDEYPEKENAVFWEWKNGYQFHWGRHLVDSIRYFSLT